MALSLRALVNGTVGRAAAMDLTATRQTTAVDRMCTQATVVGLGMVVLRM
jgi:hypothetical protein